jgi:hypothetical protein
LWLLWFLQRKSGIFWIHARTCIEHYLLIFRRRWISNNLYTACVLCPLAVNLVADVCVSVQSLGISKVFQPLTLKPLKTRLPKCTRSSSYKELLIWPPLEAISYSTPFQSPATNWQIISPWKLHNTPVISLTTSVFYCRAFRFPPSMNRSARTRLKLFNVTNQIHKKPYSIIMTWQENKASDKTKNHVPKNLSIKATPPRLWQKVPPNMRSFAYSTLSST